MDTNIVNIKSVSVSWCLHVLNSEAQFTKKLGNTDAELKKSVALLIKKRLVNDRKLFYLHRSLFNLKSFCSF